MNNASAIVQQGSNSSASSEPQKSAARDIADVIVQLFHQHGGSLYGGEHVTQLEHALQCATMGERQGAPPALVVAALTHDIGHLLHALPDDAPDKGIDDMHEELAAQWLRDRFGPEVVEPVRLHVSAKRFLCATDPVYFSQLSPPSQLSLKLQGGPMSTSEVAQFLANPFYREAVSLRRWDDEAKIVGFPTPPVEHFVAAIVACVK